MDINFTPLADEYLPSSSDAGLRAMFQRKDEERAGEIAPATLGPAASAQARYDACVSLIAWLRRVDPKYWTQEVIAERLNDLGQTTKSGVAWSQALVSVAHSARAGGNR